MDLSRFLYNPTVRVRHQDRELSTSSNSSQLPLSTRSIPSSHDMDHNTNYLKSLSSSSSSTTLGIFKKKRKLDSNDNDSITQPKVTPTPGKGLHELYVTPGNLELPLNLIIIGHNPSQKSWIKGHYYANPSNRMWSLLRKAKLIPSHYRCDQDTSCPLHCKVGFTDLVIGISETDSSKFTNEFLYEQRYHYIID